METTSLHEIGIRITEVLAHGCTGLRRSETQLDTGTTALVQLRP